MVGIGQFLHATGISDHTSLCRQSTHTPSDINFAERIFLRRTLLEPALTDRIALASYSELDGFADAKLTGAGFRRGFARARVDIRAPVRVSGIEREEHGIAIIHEAGTARASRGLGFACAASLAREGAAVVIPRRLRPQPRGLPSTALSPPPPQA